ncbi:MAG: 1-(5-phosphoribosyl)-5-[(5-phosphoribosylamino)methylideneamino]imidazole-4-carboxamide isomerase [Candidatus Dormibacteria bacterium]
MIPAIDVRGGRVVRLRQGDYARQTVYGDSPTATAATLARAGARRVHIIDLDAARGEPDPASNSAVAEVVAALVGAGVAAEVGGGVRDLSAARVWVDRGADVVIGSLAMRDPLAASQLCATFPGRVWLGLDVHQGRARAQGWTEDGGDAAALLASWREWPAAGLIHTSTARDGMLEGPDLDSLRSVVASYGGYVVASGGVTSLDDVAACAAAGCSAAIVGRALYEGHFDLAAAMERFGGAPA